MTAQVPGPKGQGSQRRQDRSTAAVRGLWLLVKKVGKFSLQPEDEY
jgi:hypothetical protein